MVGFERQMIGSLTILKTCAWFCGVWGFWAAQGLGQVIQSAPPEKSPAANSAPNPFAPPQRATPPTTNISAPIIQGLTGSESPPAAPATPEATPLFTDSLTVEMVQQRMQDVTDDPALDKATKDKLLAQYQQTLTDLSETVKQEAKAAEYLQQTQTMPAQIEEAKKKKQTLSKPVKEEPPLEAPMTQLQQELTGKEDALAEAKKKLDDAVNSLKNTTSTRGELSQTRKALQDRLAETEQQLKTLPTGMNVPKQTLADRSVLRAKWQLYRATLAQLDKQDAYRQASVELLPLVRDIAALEAGRLESEVQAWRKAVAVKRQEELDEQKRQAEKQAREALTYEKYPIIAVHADLIVENTDIGQKTAARIPQLTKQLDRTTSQWKSVQENFKQSRERVTAAGDTMNVGTLLRIQQKSLPNIRDLQRDIHARQDEIQKLQLASYEVNDRAAELTNVPKAAEDLLDSLEPQPGEDERAELKAFVEKLLENEKSQLDNLNGYYREVLDKLWRLDKVEKQLIEETEKYSQFISEHVLWIRSTGPLWDSSANDFRKSFTWLLRLEDWVNVLKALGGDFWQHPGLWTLAVAFFGLLLIEQRKLKNRIDEIGKTINKKAMTEFRPTLRVLVDTICLAILWPAVLCWVGYRLFQQLDAPASVSAVGGALFAMGLIFFPVELLRQSCRNNGLVQSHFTWPAPVVSMIRRNLRWLKILAPPFALIAAIFHSAEGDALYAHESLGRLCFTCGLLLAAWFMHRVLRPSGATFRALVANSPNGWVERLKYVFYAAGVLVPVALGCLAVVGYHYTAEQLVTRFYATALLTLAVLIVDALIQRWLLVTRRRLAMEQLRQRREAALAQAQAQQTAGTSPTGSQSPVVPNPVDVNEERPDVSEMNDQTRHLIRSMLFVGIVVGLWGVWVDVLPALAILKNVKIQALTIERVIEEPVETLTEAQPPENPDPANPAVDIPETPPETRQRTIKVPITLADLMLSVIILIVAIAAARNLPGMLEMIVLQRLPIDNAARYAITTLAQYVLMIVGGSAAFYVVGLRWQNVQWLAAALMVGLGFGLQEIFANFFSGLIVLLERPIRVGDIVTIGNTTGLVTRIRMRASTITNWERQEMIIPNKDLITGTVLNWTLSDTIQRVFIQVGVAYGSDTEKTTEVLYKVLRSHPNVMQEPPPMVTFAGFGNSTLDFELRCFLPTAAVRLITTHELHTSIDKAFREAGIEIAFPQLDLHVRSVETALPIQPITLNNSSGNSALSKGA